jgi:hypothetical protein
MKMTTYNTKEYIDSMENINGEIVEVYELNDGSSIAVFTETAEEKAS